MPRPSTTTGKAFSIAPAGIDSASPRAAMVRAALRPVSFCLLSV